MTVWNLQAQKFVWLIQANRFDFGTKLLIFRLLIYYELAM